MDKGTVITIGIGVICGLISLLAFTYHKARQRRRVYAVHTWVREWLSARYGLVPTHLHINCTDDLRWPVLVSFTHPRTGTRQNLRLACGGQLSTFSVLSETEETPRSE